MHLNKKQLGEIIVKFKALKELQLMEVEELRRKKPKYWVNPFLMKRSKYDIEAHLLKDLLWESGEEYKNFCRMSIGKFEEILLLVKPSIEKKDTPMRYSITARVRLAITLRYVASGDSFRSLEYLTHVSRKTISQFMPEVLTAIYESLQPTHLKVPETENEWQCISRDFESIWDFPHTLGAVDGKHVRIKAPPNSGSEFYNYKGYFSIVLLAVVDAHSRFIYIDVGANGKASDSTIFKNSYICRELLNKNLRIPSPTELKGQQVKTPYFFVADDAFGLGKHVMKPINRNLNLNTPQQIFNYRLGRARITVEMAFGRLASRFRVFHRPVEVSVKTCEITVKACCALHNYLTDKIQVAPEIEERSEAVKLPETFTPLSAQETDTFKFACRIRENLCKYCVTDGDVRYQWNVINKEK